MGSVFISGIAFIILTATGLRTTIIKAIPFSLRYGMGAEIGIFLSLIGLINAGFIVSDQATVVGFGGLNLKTALFVIGLIITAVLAGKTRQIHWMIYFIDAFAILSLSAPYLQGRAG